MISYIWILILFYVAFCTIMAISQQKKARSRDYALLLFRITPRVLYNAQYHRQHCTLHAFEKFGELYVHHHDDKIFDVWPDQDSILVPPGYKPQSIRMSHRAGLMISYSSLSFHPIDFKLWHYDPQVFRFIPMTSFYSGFIQNFVDYIVWIDVGSMMYMPDEATCIVGVDSGWNTDSVAMTGMPY